MGTSKSSPGPTKPFPLLPPWAQNGSPVPPPPVADGTAEDGLASPPLDGIPAVPGTAPFAQPGSIPLVNLRPAKVAMGKFTSGGGGNRVRSAGRTYVQGRGGASGAARSAIGGRASTARLGGFLSSVAARGWQEAVRVLGLARLVGQAPEAVVAALVDVLAPAGSMLEDAAARRAVNEALWSLYDRFDLEDGNLDKLDRMDRATVAEMVETSVVTYIYTRWLQELGQRIESKAVSDDQAAMLEKQVKDYVKETVKLDFTEKDVLGLDWTGTQGQHMVERIFREAYSFLEEA